MSAKKKSRVVIMMYGLCGCWHDQHAEDQHYLGQPDGCLYGERSEGDTMCKHAAFKDKQWRCNNRKALFETYHQEEKAKKQPRRAKPRNTTTQGSAL